MTTRTQIRRLEAVFALTASTLGVLLLASGARAAGDERVASAAKTGDDAAVRSLLERKADVNAALGDGSTALHWAAANDDLPLLTLLLKAGANPKAVTRVGGVTPLALAAQNGDPALIAALLGAGADPNAATQNGTTVLMYAATSGSADTVNLLLDHGAQIDAKEAVYGQTALMFAAAKNRASVIRTLIRRGADPKITSTVSSLARVRPQDDNDTTDPTETPAGAADAGERRRRRAGQTPDAPSAAASGADDGTSTTAGAGGGGFGSFGGFGGFGGFQRGPARTFGGNTALTLAARQGNIEALQALVESGADVNEANAGDKTTPLVTAICNGHYDAAKYLLDHGADPNLANVNGLEALYAVIDNQWAPISWSPIPNTDQEKVTYLELMKALIAKGADVNAKLTSRLWFRPAHHNESWVSEVGTNAFWRAAQATDIAAMKLLVAHGADTKNSNAEGVNALMVASGIGWNGNFSTQGPDTPLATVKYCLALGIDPTPVSRQGYSALSGAAYRGENGLIKLLVARGLKLDLRSSRGWTLTDMANGPSLRSSVPMKHPETVALLLKLGAPPLTPTDNEEILGIIRRRPSDASSPLSIPPISDGDKK